MVTHQPPLFRHRDPYDPLLSVDKKKNNWNQKPPLPWFQHFAFAKVFKVDNLFNNLLFVVLIFILILD